jgi:hypothetical protein
MQTLPALLGLITPAGTLAVGLAIGVALLLFVFLNKEFRSNGDNILAGIVIGLVVAAGWYVTGRFGFGENPDTLEMVYLGTNSRLAESMTFVAPLGYTEPVGILDRQFDHRHLWHSQRVWCGHRVTGV